MAPRLDLHEILKEITGPLEVYFQPPKNLAIRYPCIIYSKDSAETVFASDKPYLYELRYQVTVIDGNPDSVIPKQIAALPKTRFDRAYVVDNLYHDVFTMYF